MEKEDECIGCYNIRKENFPTYGYSHTKEAVIMQVEGWEDPDNHRKPIRLAYIKFCPVCGKKLEEKNG